MTDAQIISTLGWHVFEGVYKDFEEYIEWLDRTKSCVILVNGWNLGQYRMCEYTHVLQELRSDYD